jgi:hypothetical protein
MSMFDIFTPLEIVTRAFRLGKDFSVEVKEDQDDIYEDQAGKAILIEGWIYLVPKHGKEKRESILGTVEHDVILWDVSYGYVIHGVRYYPDGSGEPDDYDVKEVAQDLTLTDAIKKAWELFTENNLNCLFENLQETAFAVDDGFITKEEALA